MGAAMNQSFTSGARAAAPAADAGRPGCGPTSASAAALDVDPVLGSRSTDVLPGSGRPGWPRGHGCRGTPPATCRRSTWRQSPDLLRASSCSTSHGAARRLVHRVPPRIAPDVDDWTVSAGPRPGRHPAGGPAARARRARGTAERGDGARRDPGARRTGSRSSSGPIIRPPGATP